MVFDCTKLLKILIVEDELINSKLLQGLLKKSALHIREAVAVETLEGALQQLEDGDFDVVLLDLNLPDSEGLETLVRIGERCPGVAVVVITGNYGDEVGLEAVSHGAQEYLVKGRYDVHLLVKSIFYAIERKRTEYELRESEQRANTILQQSGDAMRVVDVDFNVVLSNHEMERLTGVHEKAAVGRQCHAQLHDRLCSTEGCPLRRILAGAEQVRVETVIRTKDRDEVPVEMVATPLRSGSTITGMVESYRDITEQVRAREATQRAYEAEIEDKDERLTAVQAQLVQSEKLASIGQLAAGVAHEMNTPVGFVASNFETLEGYVKKFRTILEQYETLLKGTEEEQVLRDNIAKMGELREDLSIDFILEDVQDLFDESKEGLKRVTSIIQNLRGFSRVDQAGDVVEFDINNGIEATLVVAANEIKYDADVIQELGDIPATVCNPGQINQVLLNILVNAAQSIRSQQRDTRGTITVRTHATESEIVCEISDDGPGIPPEVVSKIFDPFFTTKAVGKGTGLGLSVSYDIIVNKHKGRLHVNSRVGVGTTFTITLPIKKMDSERGTEIENHGQTNCIIC